ncbi:nuclear nucleic acid-binding protein C1D [Procambarus clarkii]|uniref:nuclear nucleic acid-binding protein C1D n=1 Tax=Procambarus clarkii TaxID=6728 RepID=UPI001E675B8F|nr:nuclear nucleic acid-binding protein C1D-like [Procambarus clarkii]
MELKTSHREAVSQGDFPPGMAPKMLNLLKIIDSLEKDLTPLISHPYHEVLNKLLSLERAKIGMMEIYTINSLFWVLMRTSGEDIDASLRDDYKVEMGRLKETQARIAEIEARAHRPTLDRPAAARFIRHGLRGNAENDQESGIAAFIANMRKKVEAQHEQESNNSSSSECDDDDSDGDNQVLPQDDPQNRSWYGKGW